LEDRTWVDEREWLARADQSGVAAKRPGFVVRGVERDVARQLDQVGFRFDLESAERRVEDVPASSAPLVEAGCIAPVQPVDRGGHIRERAEDVVVRRHEAELMADEEAFIDN